MPPPPPPAPQAPPSLNNVALQVAIVSCQYCHLHAQKHYMLQKVGVCSQRNGSNVKKGGSRERKLREAGV